ncbi:MAG: phosphotransferase [Gammaproteobacteria bacterium]|nr:phosphotransferase [Gammaproteobacteria bacterium]
MPERLEQITAWLKAEPAFAVVDIRPASADASFRRYFRVRTQDANHGDASYIVMDAPPDKEDMGPFLKVDTLLLDIGLNVPRVLAADIERGFYLLSDLGDEHYLSALTGETVQRLYGDALGALLVIQAQGPQADELPAYDRPMLLREMELFRDWLVGKHLSMTLDAAQTAMLDRSFDLLAQSALEQPQVCVHRDYHSRNLMVTPRHNPGILDFQDAVIGPVTYDLVSLLRDCYIAWPRAQVEDWALGYRELALQSGVLRPDQADEKRFLQWFDWMGVQRHLKAAGIFARLYRRDGKPGYLADIPRTLGYVVDVASHYPQLAGLDALAQDVIERLAQAASSGS